MKLGPHDAQIGRKNISMGDVLMRRKIFPSLGQEVRIPMYFAVLTVIR